MIRFRENKLLLSIMVGGLLLLTTLLAACSSKQPAPSPAAPQQEAKATNPPVTNTDTKAKAQQPATPPATLEKLVIAIPAKSLTFLPQFIGADKGFYAAEGLDASVASMKADVTIAGMVAGEVDFSAASGSTIRSAVTGAPVKLLMFTVKEMLFSFYSKQEFNSIADLKGKTIGGDAAGSTNTITAKEILEKNGITEKDVNFIMLSSTSNQFAALTSKSIDATILSPPFDAKAAEMGFKQLAWAADLLPGRPMAGMGTGDKTLKEKPDKALRVIRATLKSIDYILKNPKETKAYMAESFNLKPEEADYVYKQITPAFSANGTASEQGLQFVINEARTTADIKTEIPVSQVADFSLLTQVQKQLGLK